MIKLNTSIGTTWAHDMYSFLYGVASVSWSDLSGAITIIKCKKEYRTRKISWGGITYGEWQNKGYVSGSSLSNTDKAQLLLKLIDKGGVLNNTYSLDVIHTLDSGLQVRCVREDSKTK